MTTTEASQKNDYDSPWKEAIEIMLADFMAFYFPSAWRAIDWQQPHRFLDQELPGPYRQSMLGCHWILDFPNAKLLDYRRQEKDLAGSDNPFGLVTLAHLRTQGTRNQSARRYRAKYRLIRSLYGKGWAKSRIIQLLRIIDWLMALPSHLEQNLRQRLTAIEGETHMQYVTSFERLAKEEGVQQGRAGLLIHLLTHRFGPLPEDTHQRLEQATTEEIDVWADRVLEANSLEQVFDNK